MPLLKRWRHHSSPNFRKTTPKPDPTVESHHSACSLPPLSRPSPTQITPPRFRSSMRVVSVNDSLHHTGLMPSKSSEEMNRSVSFGNIQIRDYERVAGDNPSVTRGVPLALGWQYMEYADISVELYEHQVERRTKSELIMSPQLRSSMLKSEWNVSQREIAAAVRKTVKARNQRRQTVVNGENLVVFEHVKEGWKTCMRKIRRRSKDDLKWPQDQEDFMDYVTVSDDNLDKTKHKSSEMKIEIEEEETCATDSYQWSAGCSSRMPSDDQWDNSNHISTGDYEEQHPEEHYEEQHPEGLQF